MTSKSVIAFVGVLAFALAGCDGATQSGPDSKPSALDCTIAACLELKLTAGADCTSQGKRRMTLSIANKSSTSQTYYKLTDTTNVTLEVEGEKAGVLTASGRAEVLLLVVNPKIDVNVRALQTVSLDGKKVVELQSGTASVASC